jgi:hypothetical protein
MVIYYAAMIGAAALGAAAIQNYRSSNAGQERLTPGQVRFTMVHVKWCPHCQSALPAFKELMRSGDSRIKYRLIDAEVSPQLVPSGINGYPSYFLEVSNDTRVPYTGARDAASIRQWLQRYVF